MKTVPSKQTTDEVMNLHSYIKVKGYSISIEHRMQKWLKEDEPEKTAQDWDVIYNATMNRITK
jgi:hypothetical protein